MRRLVPFAVALAALVVGVVAFRQPARPLRQNLLLVSIDTLRADRLGSAGYAPAQTPRLDALAARGWRFTNVTTVTPLTLPAHSSLLTGTFPPHHGVRDNGGFYLDGAQTTLAEVLAGAGYRTGGFVGAFVLDSRWGIAQGFEHYFDDFDLSKYSGVGLDSVQRRGDEVVARAGEWMRAPDERPFFAWVHLYDPHAPYEAPEAVRSHFPPGLDGAYDAEIAWTDSLVGDLLDRLGTERLSETVVIVVGDHGESLGEHHEQAHGFFIYDATLQVPLLVSGPDVAPRTFPDQVRLVDVMPTALDLLGVPVPPPVQGRSLVPLSRGERLDLTALSETWYPRYHYGWSELRAARDGRYKYVAAPRPELYDLSTDPGETRNLAAEEPARTAALAGALTRAEAAVTGPAAPAGPQAVDPETEERLAALGYVGGTISARSLEDRPRPDPKDRIGLYNALKHAGTASVEGRIEEAVGLVREVLRADPEVIEAHTMLGNLYGKAGQWEEAAGAYRDALARDPEHKGAAFSLALAYKNLGRLDDAVAGFERARALDPKSGKAVWQIADIRLQKGDLAGAEASLKAGLALDVDRAAFLVKLGEVHLMAKRWSEAEHHLQEARTLKPDTPQLHYDLALAAFGRGDLATAAREYEAELARDPQAYQSSFNLGRLHLDAGRPAEAVRRLQAAVDAKPDFATGWLYLSKALLDRGDLEGAETAAKRGLDGRAERDVVPLGHFVLADVYARQGRPREAAREAAEGQRLRGGSPARAGR